MDTPNESAPVTPPETPAAPATAGGTRKVPSKTVWIAVIVVLVVLAAFVAYKKGMMGTLIPGGGAASGGSSAVVATVNGVDVTRGELDEKAAQIRATIPNMATDTESMKTFENQVLDEIINLKLLIARAEERNLSVTDDKIDSEIANLVKLLGGQEAFDAQLKSTNLTMDQLRTNMRNELMIRALVDADTNVKDVTVTDDELKASYDIAFPKGTKDAPSFDQVKDMLRAQLVRQKSEAIITKYLDDVRSAATIQKNL